MPKTLEEIRADFHRKGVTFAAWARANNISKSAMSNLLSGRSKGIKGDARKAALLLGLVDPIPGETIPQQKDAAQAAPPSVAAIEDRQSGSLRTFEHVKDALGTALKRCGLSRDVVADELSRLTGHDVSIHQLNNWAAPAKEDRPTPLHFLAALVEITGDAGLVEAALEGTGYRLLSPEDEPYYELGKMVAEDKRRTEARKALWKQIKD